MYVDGVDTIILVRTTEMVNISVVPGQTYVSQIFPPVPITRPDLSQYFINPVKYPFYVWGVTQGLSTVARPTSGQLWPY